MAKNNDLMKLYYFQITDLWKRLCEEHSNLFDLTCEEYSHLIASNLDELERVVDIKRITIEAISGLEQLRLEVIDNMNKAFNAKIENISDLLRHFENFDLEIKQRHLFRFNKLLIDIIEKIQDQNKNNQLFLEKAIDSLREIRENAMGEKSYATYNNMGSKKRSQSIATD